MVDPEKAPDLCYCARINVVTIVRHREVGAQLRDLTTWVFGDAHPHFDGPPDSERAGLFGVCLGMTTGDAALNARQGVEFAVIC
jgi:hypothetical protein